MRVERALEVLRVAPGCASSEFERAFRRLARKHHPDVGGDVGVYQELAEAREVLRSQGTQCAARPVKRVYCHANLFQFRVKG